jgi:hypothetical protein
MVMNKPIEILSSRSDIIGHYLSKPTVIGNHKEIDHNNIAQSEAIDHIRHLHITKSIKDNKSSLRVRLKIFLYISQYVS